MKTKYNSVFISDLHLGTRGCKSEELLKFLQSFECENLYLVGDIIDFWKLKSGIFWPKQHNKIIKKFFKLANHETNVIYIPGNHDENLRDYIGSNFNNVQIKEEDIYTSINGKKILVLHGDKFDAVVCSNKWLAVIGSEGYELLIYLNRWFNNIRNLLGLPYWSLSAFIKHKVKNAVNVIFNYENILLHHAKERGMDGVICGHIHHAEIKENENGITYYNCGDWVESCTALVEDLDGNFSIIKFG